jgi:hypothetical protein
LGRGSTRKTPTPALRAGAPPTSEAQGEGPSPESSPAAPVQGAGPSIHPEALRAAIGGLAVPTGPLPPLNFPGSVWLGMEPASQGHNTEASPEV